VAGIIPSAKKTFSLCVRKATRGRQRFFSPQYPADGGSAFPPWDEPGLLVAAVAILTVEREKGLVERGETQVLVVTNESFILPPGGPSLSRLMSGLGWAVQVGRSA